jgi:hypothetical protein
MIDLPKLISPSNESGNRPERNGFNFMLKVSALRIAKAKSTVRKKFLFVDSICQKVIDLPKLASRPISEGMSRKLFSLKKRSPAMNKGRYGRFCVRI